jgi:hypothetical protein
VFAMCSAISVLLSLSQIAPVQPCTPKAASVVLDQQNSQSIYPLQTT